MEKTINFNYEVIVVDNESDEPDCLEYLATINKLPNIKVINYNHPFNFSALNNFAVKQAQGKYVLLLNNDTEVLAKNWLHELLRYAEKVGVGCVGAKLFYPTGQIQHGGVVMGYGGGADHAFKMSARGDAGYMNRLITPQNYSAVTAACLLVSKSIYLQLGGLDETLEVAFNDVDFCLKVREAGYRNVWLPTAQLIHHESPTRGLDISPIKKARFDSELSKIKARWVNYIKADPAYHPALALNRHDFAYSNVCDDSSELKLR